MRAIMFRVKCIDTKNWYYFEVGSLVLDKIYNMKTLCQFTGRKDKKNIEIYKGDIVRATQIHQGFVMCVVWENQDCGWKVNYYNGSKAIQDWLCMYREVEVIGNVYDNPELLKETQ